MEIINIKHKGLKEFYLKGRTGKVDSNHLDRINTIFDVLEAAQSIHDIMALTNLRCHELKKPPLDGHYAVDVSGAWRVTFHINEQNQLELIDYLQYH